MKGSVTVIGLLVVALAGLIGAHWLILPDPSQRNYEFFPNMVESYARDAQSPPPVLDDGTALDLRPPEGSVARGYLPFEYPATPEGALLAGQELQNPFAADDAEGSSTATFAPCASGAPATATAPSRAEASRRRRACCSSTPWTWPTARCST